MIAIIDNGRRGNGHDFWFVDVGDEDPRVIGRIASFAPTYRGAHAMASAPSFEWYTSEVADIDDFINNIIDLIGDATADELKRENLEALQTLLRLTPREGFDDFLDRLREAVAAKKAEPEPLGFARPFTAAELDSIPMDDDYHD